MTGAVDGLNPHFAFSPQPATLLYSVPNAAGSLVFRNGLLIDDEDYSSGPGYFHLISALAPDVLMLRAGAAAVSAVLVIAIFNALVVGVMGFGRLYYSTGRDGVWPRPVTQARRLPSSTEVPDDSVRHPAAQCPGSTGPL